MGVEEDKVIVEAPWPYDAIDSGLEELAKSLEQQKQRKDP